MNREVIPNLDSKRTASASVMVAMTENRQAESLLIKTFREDGITAAAADFGGSFPDCLAKIVEASVVAAKREGVIQQTHAEEGAVAGACHEAIQQLMMKAIGFNVGGKVGVARLEDHLTVTIFISIGLLHLNDVAIGMAHRYI